MEHMKTLTNRSLFQLAIVKFTDTGPFPVCSDDLPFLDAETEENTFLFLIFQSALYFTVLSQTDVYFAGLYGPFPVHKSEEYVAVVHTFAVHDSDVRDERLHKKAYSALMIFYPHTYSPGFDRYEGLLADFFDTLTSDDEIDHNTLKMIRRIIDGGNQQLIEEKLDQILRNWLDLGKTFEFLVIDELKSHDIFKMILTTMIKDLESANMVSGVITIPQGTIHVVGPEDIEIYNKSYRFDAVIYLSKPLDQTGTYRARKLISRYDSQIPICWIIYLDSIYEVKSGFESISDTSARLFKTLDCHYKENSTIAFLDAFLWCLEAIVDN